MISLLFLISFPFAVAGGQHRFSIKVFTSLDDQFWANSVIIEGPREVMLVDAQLTKTNAERVFEEIKETKKLYGKHSTLRIHSWLSYRALDGSNGWTRNLEAREFANDTAICSLQHNCREQRLTPETR